MRNVYGWLLLTPAAILLIGFTHYPAVATLVDSFFSTGTVVRPSRFVGLANYALLADDPIFWQVLRNNLAFLTLLQYNSDSKQVATNLRFNWIPTPGSDFFIVYNETDSTLGAWTPRNRALTVKLNYLIAL